MAYELEIQNSNGFVSLAVLNRNCLVYQFGDRKYFVPWIGSVGEGQARTNAFQFNKGLEIFFENPAKNSEPKEGDRLVKNYGRRFVLGDLIKSVREISRN